MLGGGRQLERPAALHDHAVAGQCGHRRHHRHRCRDHQRARARQHQKDQRPIEPLAPRPVDQRRTHRHDQRRQGHRRGVDRGEALDPALDRCRGLPAGAEHPAIGDRRQRLAGPLEAPAFEPVREREEEGHRRGLGPLAHRGRANRRQADQHVHVEPQVPQRGQRTRPRPPQPGDRRQPVHRNRPAGVRVAEAAVAGVAEHRLAPGFGRDAVDHPADGEERAAHPQLRRRGARPARGRRGRRRCVHGQPGPGNRVADPGLGGLRGIDGQVDAAVHQVEGDVHHARIGVQRPADQRDLVGAVHRRDPQADIDEGAGSGGRGHGRSDRPAWRVRTIHYAAACATRPP